MRAFHKPYRLKVFGLRKTETRVDNKVAKKVTGQEGVDEAHGGPSKEETAAKTDSCRYDEHIRDNIEKARAMVRADVGWQTRLSKRKRYVMGDFDDGIEEQP